MSARTGHACEDQRDVQRNTEPHNVTSILQIVLRYTLNGY